MATVTVRRPRGRRRRNRNRDTPDAIIRARGGPTVRLPIAPRETEHSGDAPVIEAVPRPGRRPLTRLTESGLRVLSFTAIVARSGLNSVEGTLAGLRRIARDGSPLIYQHGSQLERGVWRISSITPSIIQRNSENRASYVEVAIELTEATDTEWDGRGRRRRGDGDAGRRKPGRDKARVHVWRNSDRPARVSRRYYDNPNLWHVIADANDIRKPRRIRAGRRLQIPPKDVALRRHRRRRDNDNRRRD